MTISTFGYPLNTLRDGVVGFIDKEPYSQPSVTTKVIIAWSHAPDGSHNS